MKIRAIALNTFGSLLRNKLIVLFLAGFVCVVLLMMTPMLAAKTMASTMGAGQAQGMVLGMVSAIMSMVSGFGSLMAAWAAADVVWSEMRTGTILAVMARPVRRWEFLLGKYLGVQFLMVVYVFGMLGLSYLLAWIGGEKIQSTFWVLLIYPLVRYAIYSAIALALVTIMHPVFAFVIVLLVSVGASILGPTPGMRVLLPEWLRTSLYAPLPSTHLLSEARFLVVTQASLHATPWTHHLTALAYGLNYALVCFLLAVWSFRKHSLART
jgi:ABC-type transport system involved in multi-copper enzyme maturation permease subunit